MIFVTVGTQLPFDRLAGAVNEWARAHPDHEVVAQVGPTERQFDAMRCERHLAPQRFDELFTRADAVIAHAGMGTILSAANRRRPLLVMPRRAALGEHRNEHQLATAKRLEDRIGLVVAWDERDLIDKIDEVLRLGEAAAPRVAPAPDRALLEYVRGFLLGDSDGAGRVEPGRSGRAEASPVEAAGAREGP